MGGLKKVKTPCVNISYFLLCFLEKEIEIAHSHVCCKFLKSCSSQKCLNNLFGIQTKLKISNYLQIVEICVVMPFSSAEVCLHFSSLTF